jgi:hypothetical protein
MKAATTSSSKLEQQLRGRERAQRASILFDTTPSWMHGRVTHTRRSWFDELTPKAGQPVRTLNGGWWGSPKTAVTQHIDRKMKQKEPVEFVVASEDGQEAPVMP